MASDTCRRAVALLWVPGVALAAILVLSFAQVSLLHTPTEFDDLFGQSGHRATGVFGHARFVRGDEFLTETPIAMGQARSGFHRQMTIGLGQNADVNSYAPGSWWSIAYRPLNVWFRLLSPERAVIARSWSVFALGLAAFFALARAVNAALRRRVCLLLAIGAVFSPPMMWWFTTTHWLAVSLGILGPLVATSGSASASGSVRSAHFGGFGALSGRQAHQSVAEPQNRRGRGGAIARAAAGGALLALGAMTSYPAFFLSCTVTTTLIVSGRWWHGTFRWRRVAAAVVTLLVVAGWYYRSNVEWFRAVLHTVYPGGRTSVSGEDQPLRAFSGPFSRILQREPIVVIGNPTENASPLYVFPLVLVGLVFGRRWRPTARGVRPAAIGATVALLFLWGWAFGWLPTFLGRLVGFNGVPGGRTVMALVVVCTAMGAGLMDHEDARRKVAFAAGLVGLLLAGWEGWAMRNRLGPHALSGRLIVLYSGLFAAAVAVVLVARQPTARAGVVAALSIGLTLGVHPLSIGMGSSDVVAKAIRRVDAEAGHRGRWLADDDVRVSAVVVASGVPTWSGNHFVPDLAMWKVLDPTSGAKHEWNRYAHVVFRLRGGADEQKAPVIRAVQSDAIVVELGFCRPELRALHVSRVLSTSRTEASCVASVNQFEKTRLWLYVLS